MPGRRNTPPHLADYAAEGRTHRREATPRCSATPTEPTLPAGPFAAATAPSVGNDPLRTALGSPAAASRAMGWRRPTWIVPAGNDELEMGTGPGIGKHKVRSRG